MSQNPYFDAEELLKVAQRAIDSKQFDQLNQQVQKVVGTGADQALRAAQAALSTLQQEKADAQASSARPQSVGDEPQQVYEPPRPETIQQPAAAPVDWRVVGQSMAQQAQSAIQRQAKRPETKIGTRRAIGVAQAVGGFGFVAAPSALVGSIFLLAPLLPIEGTGFAVGVGLVCLAIAALGVWLGVVGVRNCGLATSAKRWLVQLAGRDEVSIAELALLTGAPEEETRKRIERVLSKGMFPGAALDRELDMFFLTPEAYRSHADQRSKVRVDLARQRASRTARDGLSPQVKQILDEGNEYVAFFRSCNAELPGALITSKLDRLETLIRRIFAEVERDPALAGELHRFMTYYLPTTRKLVQTYLEIEREQMPTEAKLKTQEEIEKTLDTINQAFEALLDSFFDDVALDVSTDISVLQTMLAQEGLTDDGSPFKN